MSDGRCYLRRILDVIKPLKLSHHKAVWPESFYADIHWWLQILPVFNGKCLVLQNAPAHNVYVDTSGTGSGFIFANDWGGWRDIECSVNQFPINDKEMLSAVLATWRWAPLLANLQVIFYIDNITARAVLRTGSDKFRKIMPYVNHFGCLRVLMSLLMPCTYRATKTTRPTQYFASNNPVTFLHLLT